MVRLGQARKSRRARPVVDRRREPPVTVGVPLVSIADDGVARGWAAYVRGLPEV